MGKVAAYLLERAASGSAARQEAGRALDVVTRWVSRKGATPEVAKAGGAFSLRDGGKALLKRDQAELPDRAWSLLELEQPVEDGAQFRTSVSVSFAEGIVAVYCTLEVEREGPIAPIPFEARCPNLIRDLIGLSGDWRLGGSKIFLDAHVLSGAESGAWIASEIFDPRRALPIVVVSEDEGLVLHEGIEISLARDLLGLANVYRLSPEASWGLTDRLGAEWSCYNGALRLYWASAHENDDPFKHPLWTAGRLLARGRTTREAAGQLATYLRRRLMAESALSVKRPTFIDEIRQEARALEIQRHVEAARSANDYEVLAKVYAEENDRLAAENRALHTEIEKLRTDVENARAIREWQRQSEVDDLEPEPATPPQSVEEAVARTRTSFETDLLFGGDVERGVAQLPRGAGPPEKVLHYLEVLAQAARARRAGTLGKTMTAWLNERAVSASGEGETVKNSAAERARRTWDDGRGSRFFEQHLKPKEATDPASCVRIYFEWDDERRLIVVGWVGRHP